MSWLSGGGSMGIIERGQLIFSTGPQRGLKISVDCMYVYICNVREMIHDDGSSMFD